MFFDLGFSGAYYTMPYSGGTHLVFASVVFVGSWWSFGSLTRKVLSPTSRSPVKPEPVSVETSEETSRSNPKAQNSPKASYPLNILVLSREWGNGSL